MNKNSRIFDLSKLSYHSFSFLETVFCFFTTVAAFLTVSVVFEHNKDAARTIFTTAAVLAVLFFATRNKRSLLAFGILFLLSIAYFFGYRGKTTISELNNCLRLIENLFSDVKFPKGTDIEATYNLLYTLLIAVIGTAVFVFAVCFRKNYGTLIVSLAVFVSACLLCPKGLLLKVTVYLLLGIFPLLASKKSFRNGIMQSNAVKIKAAISGLVIFAVLGAVVLAVTPRDMSEYHLRRCSDAVADLHSAVQPDTANLQKETEITLAALGLQKNDAKIGGAINNDSEGVVLASVNDTKMRCFRITTFDYFTGGRWEHSDAEYYRVNGPFSDVQQKYLNASDNITGNSELGNYFSKETVSVQNLVGMWYLFGSANMTDFEETAPSNNTLLFNDRGELLSVWEENCGFSYKYDTVELNNPDDFLNSDIAKKIDGKIYDLKIQTDKGILKKYTQVPKYWSKELSEVSKKVKKEGTVKTILNCFAEFQKFDIDCVDNPQELSEKHSPIDEMLSTKTGNCVQYATALCMMLRENGVPCRLAAGYFSVPSNEEGLYYISTRSCWCWPEVYLKGVGWISLNAVTPSKTTLKIVRSGNNASKEDTVNETADAGIFDESADATEQNGRHLLNEFLIAALVLTVFFTALRILLSYILRAKPVVKFIYGDSKRVFIFYYCDLISLRKFYNIKTGIGFTMRDIENKLGEKINTELLMPYFKLAESIVYGTYEPTDSEIDEIREIIKKTDLSVRKENVFKYLLKRKLFRPLVILRKQKPTDY